MKMSVCEVTVSHRPQSNLVFDNGISLFIFGEHISNDNCTCGANYCHELNKIVCDFVHDRDAIVRSNSQLLRCKIVVTLCATRANPRKKHDTLCFVWVGSRLHQNQTFGDEFLSRKLDLGAEIFVSSCNESCHETSKIVSLELSRTKQNAAAFCDSSCADSSAEIVQSFAWSASDCGTISRSDGSREVKNAAAFFAFRSEPIACVRVRRGDAISPSTALPEYGFARTKGLLASFKSCVQIYAKMHFHYSYICTHAKAANNKYYKALYLFAAQKKVVGKRRRTMLLAQLSHNLEHTNTSAQNALCAVFVCDFSSPTFQIGASFSCGSCNAKRSRDANFGAHFCVARWFFGLPIVPLARMQSEILEHSFVTFERHKSALCKGVGVNVTV